MELESPPEPTRKLSKDDYDLLKDIRAYCESKIGALERMGYNAYIAGDIDSADDVGYVRGNIYEVILSIDNILED